MTRKPRLRPAGIPDFDAGSDITQAGLPAWDGTTWGGEPVPPWRPAGERFADPRTWRNHRALPAPPEPAPAREPDLAMFRRTDDAWTLQCGLCPAGQRAAHSDTATARADRTFDALRASARAAQWRTDLFGQWACPACQDTPAYWSPPSVDFWSANAVNARDCGDESGEFWHIVVAGQAAAERTRRARHARGAVLIRPDGRFLVASVVAGEPPKDGRPGRHRAETLDDDNWWDE